jgi:hypothetical protein
MNSLEVWEQVLILLGYLGLYLFVKKFMISKYKNRRQTDGKRNGQR